MQKSWPSGDSSDPVSALDSAGDPKIKGHGTWQLTTRYSWTNPNVIKVNLMGLFLAPSLNWSLDSFSGTPLRRFTKNLSLSSFSSFLTFYVTFVGWFDYLGCFHCFVCYGSGPSFLNSSLCWLDEGAWLCMLFTTAASMSSGCNGKAWIRWVEEF